MTAHSIELAKNSDALPVASCLRKQQNGRCKQTPGFLALPASLHVSSDATRQGLKARVYDGPSQPRPCPSPFPSTAPGSAGSTASPNVGARAHPASSSNPKDYGPYRCGICTKRRPASWRTHMGRDQILDFLISFVAVSAVSYFIAGLLFVVVLMAVAAARAVAAVLPGLLLIGAALALLTERAGRSACSPLPTFLLVVAGTAALILALWCVGEVIHYWRHWRSRPDTSLGTRALAESAVERG